MGCCDSNSRGSNEILLQRPQNFGISLNRPQKGFSTSDPVFVDPFTLMSIHTKNLSADHAYLLYGDKEEKRITSSHILKRENPNLFICNLNKNGQPANPIKLSMSVKEMNKENNKQILENLDYTFEVVQQKIKISLPIQNLQSNKNYLWQASLIIDSNSQVTINFRFKLTEDYSLKGLYDNASNTVQQIKNHIELSTLGNLTVLNCELCIGTDMDLKPALSPFGFEYGTELTMKFQDLNGFAEKNSFSKVGFAMMLINLRGQELYYDDNLIPEETNIAVEDLQELQPHIRVAGQDFNPYDEIIWVCLLWDKQSNGKVALKCKYHGKEKAIAIAKLVETQKIGGDIQVTARGRSGFIDEKEITFFPDPKIFAKIMDLMEKEVEIYATYEPLYIQTNNKKNLIFYEDKAIFWRIEKIVPI